jgi:modification methylase
MVALNEIYNEDCLAFMAKIPDNSVDLIITSPPYNKGFYTSKNAGQSSLWSQLNGKKINYDIYSDDMPPNEYEAWQKSVIAECVRIMKPTGSLLYNHKDVIYKGLIVPPKWVYDFKVRQQIIWDRKSSLQLDPHYFMPANEWIYWIVKDEKSVFFDKSKSIYKTNIWTINTDRNPHPAPFPLIMCENIVNCLSPEGGVIYDPFMGSGTTALATIKIGGAENTSVPNFLRRIVRWRENGFKENKANLKFLTYDTKRIHRVRSRN